MPMPDNDEFARAIMPRAIRPRAFVLIAAAIASLTLACDRGERSNPEPETESPAASASGEVESGAETVEQRAQGDDETDPIAPPQRFAAATDRQQQLYAAAMQALGDGDQDGAVAALIALSQTQPVSEVRALGTLLLSELYRAEGRSARAIELLRELRTSAPPMAELEYILGSSLAQEGETGQAEEALRRAILTNPEFLPPYLELMASLRARDRSDEAREISLRYERAIFQMSDELTSELPVERKRMVIARLEQGAPDDRAARALAAVVRDGSEGLRLAAAEALTRVGTPLVIDALRETASEGVSPDLATAIEEAIAAIEERAAEDAPSDDDAE